MNAVDIVILVVLIGGAAYGFRQGFIVEASALLGAVIALAAARAEYRPVRHVLAQVAPHSGWLTIVSYLIVFLAVLAAISLIARRLRWLARRLMLGWIDRFGGIVLGLIQASLVLALLLYLGKRVPATALRHAVRHSSLAPVFEQIVPYVHSLLPHVPGY